LTKEKIENEYNFSLIFKITVDNNLNQTICDHSQEVEFKYHASDLKTLVENKIYYSRSLNLEPGTHKIIIYIIDKYNRKIGFLYRKYQVPELGIDRLCMSDIVLFCNKTEGMNDQYQVEDIPSATRKFHPGKEMNVCFEAYNLSVDSNSKKCNFEVEYSFSQKGRVLVRTNHHPQKATTERDCKVKISFKLAGFRPGEYDLSIKLRDKISGEEITRKTKFWVIQ